MSSFPVAPNASMSAGGAAAEVTNPTIGNDGAAVFVLEVGDGTVSDSSAYANTISLVTLPSVSGTATLTTETDVPNGNYTHSLRLNPNASPAGGQFEVAMSEADLLNFDGNFTIEYWIKRRAKGGDDGSPQYPTLLCSDASAFNSDAYWHGYEGSWAGSYWTLQMAFYTDRPSAAVSGNEGEWVHVAIVRAFDKGIAYYVNGALVSTYDRTADFDLTRPNDTLLIGGNNWSGDNAVVPANICGLIISNYAKYLDAFTPT